MSLRSNRIQLAAGRLALLCASWLWCSPGTALSQTVASPSAAVRTDIQEAKRAQVARRAMNRVRRQESARKARASREARPVRNGAPERSENTPTAGRPAGGENSPQPGTGPREDAPVAEAALPDTGPDGLRKPRVCASRAELENVARAYCSNNLPAALETHAAWESKRLRELEAEVSRKAEALAALVQESRTWVERREKLWVTARDGLVEIYAKMRPEVAAQQLAAMNEESAASIIAKLNSRTASAILNEMASEKAARLADGVLRGPRDKAAQEKSGS